MNNYRVENHFITSNKFGNKKFQISVDDLKQIKEKINNFQVSGDIIDSDLILKITTLEERINELKIALGDLVKVDMESIQKDVNSLQVQDKAFIEELKNFQTYIYDLENDFNKKIIDLKSNIQDTDISTVKNSLETLQQDFINYKETIDEDIENIENRFNRVENFEQDIITNTSNISTFQSKFDDIDIRLTHVTEVVNDTNSCELALESRVTNLEGRLATVNYERIEEIESTIKSFKEEMNEEIDGIKNKYQNLSELLNEANTAINDLNTRLTTVETDLDTVKTKMESYWQYT